MSAKEIGAASVITATRKLQREHSALLVAQKQRLSLPDSAFFLADLLLELRRQVFRIATGTVAGAKRLISMANGS